MDTFDDFSLFEFWFGNAADARGPKVGVTCLNAAETTKVFVTLFLPLGDQIRISNAFTNAPIVKLTLKWFLENDEKLKFYKYVKVHIYKRKYNF